MSRGSRRAGKTRARGSSVHYEPSHKRSGSMTAKNVIIVGGGFAGVTLAKALESRMPTEWQIYLLSQENFISL